MTCSVIMAIVDVEVTLLDSKCLWLSSIRSGSVFFFQFNLYLYK